MSTRGMWAVVVAIALVSLGCANTSDDSSAPDCDRTADPEVSVARVWNEVLLDAIRRDHPTPTVHSRNLFHVSVAMWDAWAAYDPSATGYIVDEDHEADDLDAARETALSHAVYRLLGHRYATSPGADVTLADLDATMESLCLSTEYVSTDGESPAALGNRIADNVIQFGLTDGAREATGYTGDGSAADGYAPVNAPLMLSDAGAALAEPNRWQPLAFATESTGEPTDEGSSPSVVVQEFVSPHWGQVSPFALPLAAAADGLPHDPGDPPYLGAADTDTAFKDAVVEVIVYGATLDPSDGVAVDISPGTVGNNPLGTYAGAGHAENPSTGAPYEPNVAPLGDVGRVLAEFWADGPQSETPPGHWNTIANAVSDHRDLDRRVAGTGDPVDRLEWDVKLYFALNGALHDAAIAGWASKQHYDYVRPISMIRYMGGLGQSTDPDAPSYHPDGLPLADGVIEVVTVESSRPGERHEHLSDRTGAVAIRTWAGHPADPRTGRGGVGWIDAEAWVPYQRSTFVTPAFAGYVSGHSTFSRAAAEVLTGFSGSEFFPGGLGEWTVPAGSLEFEAGPTDDITLQWATYYDAADQAGLSRLYGGIHVRADDLAGRAMGARVGVDAWELAQQYFDGAVSG